MAPKRNKKCSNKNNQKKHLGKSLPTLTSIQRREKNRLRMRRKRATEKNRAPALTLIHRREKNRLRMQRKRAADIDNQQNITNAKRIKKSTPIQRREKTRLQMRKKRTAKTIKQQDNSIRFIKKTKHFQ